MGLTPGDVRAIAGRLDVRPSKRLGQNFVVEQGTVRQIAALAWCEALTRITEGHAPDAVYDELTQVFNEKEIADLTLAVGIINNWNRLAIASRMVPGLYQPAKTAAA